MALLPPAFPLCPQLPAVNPHPYRLGVSPLRAMAGAHRRRNPTHLPHTPIKPCHLHPTGRRRLNGLATTSPQTLVPNCPLPAAALAVRPPHSPPSPVAAAPTRIPTRVRMAATAPSSLLLPPFPPSCPRGPRRPTPHPPRAIRMLQHKRRVPIARCPPSLKPLGYRRHSPPPRTPLHLQRHTPWGVGLLPSET